MEIHADDKPAGKSIESGTGKTLKNPASQERRTSIMAFTWATMRSLFSKPVTKNYPAEPIEYPERSRGHIEIEIEKCISCSICAKNCPSGCLTVDRKAGTWTINRFDCIACGYCTLKCPKKCLSLIPGYQTPAGEKSSVTYTRPKPEPKPAAKPAAAGAKPAVKPAGTVAPKTAAKPAAAPTIKPAGVEEKPVIKPAGAEEKPVIKPAGAEAKPAAAADSTSASAAQTTGNETK